MKIVNVHVKLRRAHHVEVPMTTSGTTVYLGSSVVGPRDNDFEKSFLSPFWIVRVTNKKEDANMEMAKGPEGFKRIPVLKNKAAITPNRPPGEFRGVVWIHQYDEYSLCLVPS